MSYNDYNYNPTPPRYNGNYGQTASLTNRVSAVMRLVYLEMTLALVVTGLVAFFCANSQGYMTFLATHSWMMWVLIIAQFGMVFLISGAINKMSSGVAFVLFMVYSVLMGLWTAPIFLVYTGASIAKTFFITAGTFAAMSVYGFTTKQDLTKFGSFLFMALIGLIIVSLVNIFLKSDGLSWIISIAGVLIFIGLTAWDTQTIKRMAAAAPTDRIGHLATLGALSLYLDFINLFLYLLRFFGNRD